MSLKHQYDIGRQIKAYAGIALTSAGIPSSSGGVAQNGATIDRLALARQYYSCRSVVRGRFVASTVNAVTLAASFQHSSDGTSWDNFSTATNASKAFGRRRRPARRRWRTWSSSPSASSARAATSAR
jgi:hypothetical protein